MLAICWVVIVSIPIYQLQLSKTSRTTVWFGVALEKLVQHFHTSITLFIFHVFVFFFFISLNNNGDWQFCRIGCLLPDMCTLVAAHASIHKHNILQHEHIFYLFYPFKLISSEQLSLTFLQLSLFARSKLNFQIGPISELWVTIIFLISLFILWCVYICFLSSSDFKRNCENCKQNAMVEQCNGICWTWTNILIVAYCNTSCWRHFSSIWAIDNLVIFNSAEISKHIAHS